MTDLQLAETLFINAEGEVKAFPEHARQAEVHEARLLTPLPFGGPMDEVICHHTVIWTPVGNWPEPAKLALARLYREREAARELVIAWYLQWLNSSGASFPFSDALHALVRRCRDEAWVRNFPGSGHDITER